jgi:hypothetical protein
MPTAMEFIVATLQAVSHVRLPRMMLNRFRRLVALHAHHRREPPAGLSTCPALACRIKAVPFTPVFRVGQGRPSKTQLLSLPSRPLIPPVRLYILVASAHPPPSRN